MNREKDQYCSPRQEGSPREHDFGLSSKLTCIKTEFWALGLRAGWKERKGGDSEAILRFSL